MKFQRWILYLNLILFGLNFDAAICGNLLCAIASVLCIVNVWVHLEKPCKCEK
jgi:hypothetical protein